MVDSVRRVKKRIERSHTRINPKRRSAEKMLFSEVECGRVKKELRLSFDAEM